MVDPELGEVKPLQSDFGVNITIEECACEFTEILVDDQESVSRVFLF